MLGGVAVASLRKCGLERRAAVLQPRVPPRIIVMLPSLELTMADNKSKSGGQDRKRISLSQDYEVRDWAKKFGVTPDELKAAVKAVGDDAAAVEAHLKGKQR
jgi:hypothetical protein